MDGQEVPKKFSNGELPVEVWPSPATQDFNVILFISYLYRNILNRSPGPDLHSRPLQIWVSRILVYRISPLSYSLVELLGGALKNRSAFIR